MATKASKRRRNGPMRPKSPLAAALGRAYRERREGQEIGLRPLSQRLGLSIYAIRRHEGGEMMMRADDLYRSARIFGCREYELLDAGDADV